MVFQFETGIFDEDIQFLERLGDTRLVNVQDKQAPVYDSVVGKYTNQSVVTGDISGGNEGDTLVINSSGEVQTNNVLRIDTVNNRVGINKDPTEDLDIDGNIQINTSGLGRLVFYDSNGDHEHAEVDADDDGLVNGGMLTFSTKVDGGSVTEKVRINNLGAIGTLGANYGEDGFIFTSKGPLDAPYWRKLERTAASLPADQNIPPYTRTAVSFQSTYGNVNSWSGTTYTFDNTGDFLITFCCEPTGQNGTSDVIFNSYGYLLRNGTTIFNLSTVAGLTGSGETYIRLPISFSTVEHYDANDTLGIDLLLQVTGSLPYITKLGTRLTITQLA